MTPGIVIPLLALPIALFFAFTFYRRRMAALAVGDASRELPGARLTSESLHLMPHPPWRVVVEIGPDVLGGVDHVVIGPHGIIAITTAVADRPTDVLDRDPMMVASAAIARARVDELTQRVGLRCGLSAKVFWGSPSPGSPAGRPGQNGTVDVEGQRLARWLQSLPPGPLTATQVDLAWQAVVIGIGRPDPLP